MVRGNVARILDRVLTRWHQRRMMGASAVELTSTDRKIRAPMPIVRDIHVSVGDLREIAVKGAGADRLMQRMITAYGIDIKQMHDEAPTMLRDVVVLCSKCREKERCARELDAGTAAEHANEFCPNAEAFSSMR